MAAGAKVTHTAGPWKYYEGSRSVYGADSRYADGEQAICVLCGPRNRPAVHRVANARLIAAAPDLLAELSVTDPLCQVLCTVALHKDVLPHLPSGVLEQVKAWLRDSRGQAVIAKAEGGS